MLTKELYLKYYSGRQTKDCVVIDKDTFGFLLLGLDRYALDENGKKKFFDEDGNPRVHLVLIEKKQGKAIIDGTSYQGFANPHLGYSLIPKRQIVVTEIWGGSAALGDGDDDMEDSGHDTKILSGAVKLNTINGRLYCARHGDRDVVIRDGVSNWRSIANRQQMPDIIENTSNQGFAQVDGFSENELYAVGGYSDVWRFKNNVWQQIHLPTNILTERVCCAGDGYVYIGGQMGTVWRGRDDKWQLIHKGEFTLPFEDLVWYQDRVWCTSDYGLWQIVDGKLIEAADAGVPYWVTSCSGSLATNDGVLMVAGMYGACIHDGKEWKMVVHHSME